MKTKALLICVNYNSYSQLKEYLYSIDDSLVNANDIELLVLISDNSEITEKIDINFHFKYCQLCTNNNLGYFGGVEFAIRTANINVSEFDYTIISNVDLKLADDFFQKLTELKLNDEIGCVAPAIISSVENGDRNPKILTRNTKKKMQILCCFYKYPILYYAYSKLLYPIRRRRIRAVGKNNKTESKLIYAAHGSFMIFTKQTANFIQNMQYPTFLFGEEIFVAEELSKRGLKTIYCSSLIVNDTEHASTGTLKKKTYFKYNHDAITMLLKRYYV